MSLFKPCLIGLLIALAPPLQAGVDAVPGNRFELGAHGHVLVPVSINGSPTQQFAVDTAASHIVLDTSSFAAQFPDTESPSTGHGAHGAHGMVAAVPAQLQSVSLWEQEQGDLEGALLPIEALSPRGKPDFSGVLGIPYLSRFELDFDFGRNTLALRESPEAADCSLCQNSEAMDLGTLPGGLASLEVSVNGNSLLSILDTGASKSVVNAAAARLLSGQDLVSGDSFQATATIGNLYVSPPCEVSYVNLPIFKNLLPEEQPLMILGLDVLAGARMQLDLQHRKVMFQPSIARAES